MHQILVMMLEVCLQMPVSSTSLAHNVNIAPQLIYVYEGYTMYIYVCTYRIRYVYDEGE